MLRAAVAAGHADRPQGQGRHGARRARARTTIVVGIVADRIEQTDARSGFILDGFPRTVAQAEALDEMLAEKGIALDAVIELKVDEHALVERIAKRARETQARGEPVRKDDNPDAFKIRLDAYREQTAPLSDYYRAKGMLETTDGMASMDNVSAAIGRILDPLVAKSRSEVA